MREPFLESVDRVKERFGVALTVIQELGVVAHVIVLQLSFTEGEYHFTCKHLPGCQANENGNLHEKYKRRESVHSFFILQSPLFQNFLVPLLF